MFAGIWNSMESRGQKDGGSRCPEENLRCLQESNRCPGLFCSNRNVHCFCQEQSNSIYIYSKKRYTCSHIRMVIVTVVRYEHQLRIAVPGLHTFVSDQEKKRLVEV